MELHEVQATILRTLRHSPSARYTALRQPTGLESDAFKFHLRKLVAQGYIHKSDDGAYKLTPVGKEFANNLGRVRPMVTQKQPKLSVAIVASRDFGGTVKYLFQQRLRHPFYGFWGCLTGPVQWGESIEAAAKREFEKQTGLTAAYAVRAFYRKTDYAAEVNTLLEDKLFAIVVATNVRGELTNEWQKGLNAWMLPESLKAQEKYFASTYEFIEMLERGGQYSAGISHYDPDEY